MPLVDEGILTDMVLEPKAKISALSAQLNSLEESTRKAEPKLRSVLYKSLDDGEKYELNSIATTLYPLINTFPLENSLQDVGGDSQRPNC